MEHIEIAIVGGGPAGAFCAYNLAKHGSYPSIFDASHPREKPCGGRVSPFALRKFPILHNVPKSKIYVNRCCLVSPRGAKALVFGKIGMNISRMQLDRFLLDTAIAAGSVHIKERVLTIRREDTNWVLATKRRKIRSKFLIGADGVNSMVRRRILGRIPPENLGICFGYFVTGRKPMLIKYLEDIPGFIWSFPREDHTSIGIGSDFRYGKCLKPVLKRFTRVHYRGLKIISEWAATIPSVKDPGFLRLPCAGDNWGLIGDAAGHVDPITGEGILYALWDGELLARALEKGDIALFDTFWRTEYGQNLIAAIKLRDLLYNTHVLEISVRLAAGSRSHGKIICDMINHELEHQMFYKRILHELPKILSEYVRNIITSS
ncbi:MAG: NAD(P)/FAD-dependent oxidoreductase [Candidatus Bathyarchaeota archaeon]|nr:NAD(P)/FAD-dependent oxidoreductase [Candidatus Bathyarchaeota archaeon]